MKILFPGKEKGISPRTHEKIGAWIQQTNLQVSDEGFNPEVDYLECAAGIYKRALCLRLLYNMLFRQRESFNYFHY
jgi:hypothetical protein